MNKSKEPEVSAENITIKKPVQTAEQRIQALESYIITMDPYIKGVVSEIPQLRDKLATLDGEITRLAGIQARANSYIDGQLKHIDETFNSLAIIIKKMDDEYKELMSDIDYQDTSDQPQSEEVAESTDKV